MPITLPRASRRSFLQGTLTGIVGTLFSGTLSAAEPRRSPDVWALFSDTHIPGDRTKTGGKSPVNPVEHLTAFRTDVLSDAVGKPSGLIVTGDCAYLHGDPTDYDTLLDEFTPFREAELDVHFVMGNHDNRKNFLDALARKVGEKPLRKIPDRLCSVIETPKANFFLLDSLEKTNRTSGLFGDAQLGWLETQLDARKDKPAILFAHHYLDYTGQIVKNPHALFDTEDFWKRIKDRKQVKAYVFGHSHAWGNLKKDGVHLVNLPASAWRFDSSQPFGWVLCELNDGGVKLTLRSLDPEHPKHNQILELAWRD